MEWLAKTFARAFVRRLAYLAVAAILMGLGFHAKAQSTANCSFTEASSPEYCPDQGIANMMALRIANRYLTPETQIAPVEVNVSARSVRYRVVWKHATNAAIASGDRLWLPGQSCSERNRDALADAQPWYSQPSSCISGCQVSGENYSLDNGGVQVYGMRNRSYTGEMCSPPVPTDDIQQAQDEKEDATQPKQPECNALGNGQTSCVKPNGDHCATASSGKSFCWSTTETGKKTDGEHAQVKDREGLPVTPPNVNIQDKDWQRKEGHKATACVNSTCTTYNVTNFTAVAAGTAKNATGDNNANGTGNTSGNGTPSPGTGNGKPGDGDGDEEGDSATDSGNCTAAPACNGDTLKCLHLRYTWKTQCNTSRAEVTNGQGCGEADVPVCVGNSCKAEEYASLLQQWKARCAVQAMGEGMAARTARIDNSDDAGVVEGIWGGEQDGTGVVLRRDLITLQAGGQLLPSVTIEGQTWEVPQGFYDALAAIRMLLIAVSTVMAAFIVGRNI